MCLRPQACFRTALVLAVILGGSAAAAQSATGTVEKPLLPSEALKKAFDDLAANKGQQKDICRGYLAQARTEGLPEDERFALAELYFVSLMPDESKALFQPFLAGTDFRARMAWQRMMRMNAVAYEDFAAVEKALPEYRAKFPPDRRDLYHSYSGVQGLADHYRKAGDHQKVVDLVSAEIAQLPADAPFYSAVLAGSFFESFAKVGKAAEAARILTTALKAFETAKVDHQAIGWPAEPLRLEEIKAPVAFHDKTHQRLKESVAMLSAAPAAKAPPARP